MLDPLTAVSLASCVVQFTEFGIKLIERSIELYNSANGLNAERSNLELKTKHVRKLAEKIVAFEHEGFHESNGRLINIAKSCDSIAKRLLSVLDDLKVKRLAGPGRKWESFRKAVADLTPHNKKKIATLEADFRLMQEMIFSEIQIMMR